MSYFLFYCKHGWVHLILYPLLFWFIIKVSLFLKKRKNRKSLFQWPLATTLASFISLKTVKKSLDAMAQAFSWLQRSEVKNLVYTGFIDDKSSEIAVSRGKD